ncbi:MAG: hypothetical protein EOM51_07765 [Clostridia bacterium]|nr:hypothetical protein [Clostridia bacterium]
MEVNMKKKKHEGVYFFWSTSIIICMLVCVFVLGFTSCKKGTQTPDVSETPTETAEVSQSAEPSETDTPQSSETPGVIPSPTQGAEALLNETEDMGQAYVDKFVFLGDSTTYGLGYYDIVPDSQVWTPASGTLTLSLWSTATIVYPEDGSEIPIKDAALKKQPEYMLITLGVNGVSFMDEEYFITEYTNLVLAIKEASPNTKIILNSIYPVSASYPVSNGITNEKIDAANVWIERIANSTGIKYLDSESVLKGSDGYLPESYNNGDGLHLNADSFALVMKYLRTHGY